MEAPNIKGSGFESLSNKTIPKKISMIFMFDNKAKSKGL